MSHVAASRRLSACLLQSTLFALLLVASHPQFASCGEGKQTEPQASDLGVSDPAARDAALDFFERKIRPVLVASCYDCHSAESDVLQGGLRVDAAAAMRRGGDSGAAVKPGDPQASLLVNALRYDGMEMPPDQPLPENVIRDFEQWILSGALMPEDNEPAQPSEPLADESIDWEQARQFWAFQTPTTHHPSEVEGHSLADPKWSTGKIDEFVAARLAVRGLQPNAAASKSTWLRRVTIDLTGLPPTTDQIKRFELDRDPHAKERVVDQLLASPQHAERWGRVWLDVARFAEDQAHIVGNNDSLTYPNAFYYRDWVIRALANDMPYDQFIRMQLAADLIEPENLDGHIATGFIGLGPKYYRRNAPEVMADEWEDRIDTVSRGLLGLTVACARCHDHKYDPIPSSDYYALAGVFASTEMFNRPLSKSAEAKEGQAKKPQDAVHIVREGKPTDLNVMIRGDAKRLGPTVERGFLRVLGDFDRESFQQGSGRLALAECIADPKNPLTARVIVNRVWRELIGQSLVATPSNFGSLGSRPTHPLLLDDLSSRFVQSGWSLKWLQREIVLSSTYGRSSDIHSRHAEIDPDNHLLWRMGRRRLSLEAYRDGILTASGELDRSIGGPSMDPQDPQATRRTVYSEVSRLDLNPMLARFDFPDPNAHSPARHETTTPLQKLFLLNSPFLIHHAERLAARVQNHHPSLEQQIQYAYQVVYGRKPQTQELDLAVAFLSGDQQDGNQQDNLIESGGAKAISDRWNQFAQVLLISNEMFMLD